MQSPYSAGFLHSEIEKRRQKNPDKRLKKLSFMKGIEESEVLFIYFGKQVMTKAEEVIKVIKNQVNALWIANHKLPSGNSPSGQLTALRERFWEVEAAKRARDAQASFLQRNKDLPGTAEEKLRSRAEKLRTNI